jgi:hypothetical protein
MFGGGGYQTQDEVLAQLCKPFDIGFYTHTLAKVTTYDDINQDNTAVQPRPELFEGKLLQITSDLEFSEPTMDELREV